MVATLTWQDNQLCLAGQVNFDNAAEVYQQGLQYLQQQVNFPVQVNLAGVEQANTLVLAMLIQWLRACPTLQSLQFVAMPEKMYGILRASNLQHMIA